MVGKPSNIAVFVSVALAALSGQLSRALDALDIAERGCSLLARDPASCTDMLDQGWISWQGLFILAAVAIYVWSAHSRLNERHSEILRRQNEINGQIDLIPDTIENEVARGLSQIDVGAKEKLTEVTKHAERLFYAHQNEALRREGNLVSREELDNVDASLRQAILDEWGNTEQKLIDLQLENEALRNELDTKMADADEKFDRLLKAMTGPKAEIPHKGSKGQGSSGSGCRADHPQDRHDQKSEEG